PETLFAAWERTAVMAFRQVHAACGCALSIARSSGSAALSPVHARSIKACCSSGVHFGLERSCVGAGTMAVVCAWVCSIVFFGMLWSPSLAPLSAVVLVVASGLQLGAHQIISDSLQFFHFREEGHIACVDR